LYLILSYFLYSNFYYEYKIKLEKEKPQQKLYTT
jgi:hypothetical protein